MKTKVEDKEVLTVEEAIKHYSLSVPKFRAIIREGNNDFAVRYFKKRALVLKPQFEKYLKEHPEIRRRDML